MIRGIFDFHSGPSVWTVQSFLQRIVRKTGKDMADNGKMRNFAADQPKGMCYATNTFTKCHPDGKRFNDECSKEEYDGH
jgi:hypothetical protein